MNLSTHQLSFNSLPNTSQNPNFPTPNVQQQQKQEQNHEKAMDKLREAILELANSEPNVPLSATQNTVLQQRLAHFLSCLHTTPDHPPYSWMIEKALQELDEKGGSSEDSISKFIKKEYDSLSWAHTTLLKYHLQKMSENGQVIKIDGGRFLLPGHNKSLNPKRKRKRKRRRDWEIKQKKPRKKQKEEKRVQYDDAEVVKEQKILDEQQNEVTINELSTYKKDGQLSGQQNNVAGNKVFRKRGQRVRVVHKQKGKQQLDATEEIKHLEDLELQQPKLSLSRVEETTNISNLYPQEILENDQLGENLPQILSPEAPPGFEFLVVDEDVTANKAHNASSVGLDSQKEDRIVHQSSEIPAEDQAPRMDDLPDAIKQSKESLKQQSLETERLKEKSIAENLLKTEKQDTERSEEDSVAEDLLKTKKQQKKHHDTQQRNRPARALTRAQRKGTITSNAPVVMALECQQQDQQEELAMESSFKPKQPSIPRKMTKTLLKSISSEPAGSIDLSALKHLEQENSPETKQQVGKPCLSKKIGAQQQDQHISEPNQLAVRRKRTRTQQIGIVTQPPSSTDLFASNHLEQENSSETKQQVDKPCGLSEKTGALPNEMIIPDVQRNFDIREVQQLTELSKMEGSHEIVIATVESSSEKKQQLEEGRSTSKKLNVDNKLDVLLLQSPTRFEAVSIDKSSQTDRTQRQLKRWSRNPGEPNSVCTSKVEPLPLCASTDQHSVKWKSI